MCQNKQVIVLRVTLYYQHYTVCTIKYEFRNIAVNLKDCMQYILNEDKLASLGER